jgi:hypothetical protein
LRIFFSGECKILKLHSNEAAQIIVVEIQFWLDDDSSITVWIDRNNRRNFICRFLRSETFHRFQFEAIQTMSFSMMKQPEWETFNSPKYLNQNGWRQLVFWASTRLRNGQTLRINRLKPKETPFRTMWFLDLFRPGIPSRKSQRFQRMVDRLEFDESLWLFQFFLAKDNMLWYGMLPMSNFTPIAWNAEMRLAG